MTIKNHAAFRWSRQFGVSFTAFMVAAHGLFILTANLLDELSIRRGTHLSNLRFDVPILVGLSLLYLSILLKRKKQKAWGVSVIAYGAYLVVSALNLINFDHIRPINALQIVRVVVLPIFIISLLFCMRSQFRVHSDTEGFRLAARTTALILIVAFVYGVVGFLLFDKTDFHQEISFGSAIHHTLDQFDLTTAHPLQPYTKRAHLFVDSLSFISVGAIVYALVSLFQPLRARFSDQTQNRQHMENLLKDYQAISEEYFKLWPHDKHYFFDQTEESGLALHVYRGVALCLSDPVGNPARFKSLLQDFADSCFSNDWLPALIHIEDKYQSLYKDLGYSLQKIGQEAIMSIEHFQLNVRTNKYFRQITNKFSKQSYSYEFLSPPHHSAIINRLKNISDEWLNQPGRVERGFVMGYFSEAYLQQCQLVIARDAAGTIEGFLNLVPANFNNEEATYDMLRHSSSGLGNINDFLLLSTIYELEKVGYKHLNLGLCPLMGLEKSEDSQKSVIDSILRFAYANGDRFYSFSGLVRFKAKYEPNWQGRYIAYKGGVAGFSRVTNALNRAMRLPRHSKN